MKDQYFADFGDYQKVSLLQILKDENLSLVVHWLKTQDDLSTDGKHIKYLDTPLLWRDYEPEIYDYLKTKLATGSRSLRHIEESLFCEDIHFINNLIEDRSERKKSIDLITQNSTFDLVFFDPDNGIEVASTNKKNIHKYVLWEEIIAAYSSGKSVMIYQHFSRSNREVFIKIKLEDLKQRLGAEVMALRGKHSVYLWAIQPQHSDKIKSALSKFSAKWKGLGTVV
ncbi:MAG: hypothetical protein K9M11_02530 [Candidatus Pacebacteria bacterium]|nr:hypothetical protein [Candidatus Paceibacterota bacterium]